MTTGEKCNTMNDRVIRANILDKDIEKAGGQLDVDPYHFLELTVGNIINRLLFTERFINVILLLSIWNIF